MKVKIKNKKKFTIKGVSRVELSILINLLDIANSEKVATECGMPEKKVNDILNNMWDVMVDANA